MNYINPILEQVFKNRKYTPEFLDRIQHPLPPEPLYNENEFADFLWNHKDQIFCIMSDTDTDGIMAGVIAYAGLTDMGFKAVIHIPPAHAYGISSQEVQNLCDESVQHILLTCDVGIKEFDGCRTAYQNGLKVLITDHHQPDDQLPMCELAVNPCLKEDPRSLKNICGAQVILHLLETYARKYQPDACAALEILHPLAGIACVADMMPMLDENRLLVMETIRTCKILSRIEPYEMYGPLPSATHQAMQGLRELLKFCTFEKKISEFTEETISFTIAPLLNTIKRMGSELNLSVEIPYKLFLGHAPKENLDILISTRKQFQEQVEECLIQLKELPQPMAPYIYFADVPPGFCGYIAARLKEESGMPTLVVHPKSCKGSGRCPTWYDGKDRINNTNTAVCSGHLQSFGIQINDPDMLFQFLQTDIPAHQPQEYTQDTFDILIDCSRFHTDESSIPFNYQNIHRLTYDINQWRPYGNFFEKPKIGLHLNGCDLMKKVIGSEKQHVKLSHPDFDILLWKQARTFPSGIPQDFKLTGTFERSSYNGYDTIQFIGNFTPSA